MDSNKIVNLGEVMSHGLTGHHCQAIVSFESMEKCVDPAFRCSNAETSVWFADFCEEHTLTAAVKREERVLRYE